MFSSGQMEAFHAGRAALHTPSYQLSFQSPLLSHPILIDFTDEWEHMFFVILCLAYRTHHVFPKLHIHHHKWSDFLKFQWLSRIALYVQGMFKTLMLWVFYEKTMSEVQDFTPKWYHLASHIFNMFHRHNFANPIFFLNSREMNNSLVVCVAFLVLSITQ